MLELAPVGWAIAIVAALVFGHVNPRVPVSPEPDWHYGVIDARSFHSAGGVHRFTLRPLFSDDPAPVEVLYIGALPDSVCAGVDANVEGVSEGGLLVASQVRGPTCTKGFECRRWQCLPMEQRPEECQRPLRYQ